MTQPLAPLTTKGPLARLLIAAVLALLLSAEMAPASASPSLARGDGLLLDVRRFCRVSVSNDESVLREFAWALMGEGFDPKTPVEWGWMVPTVDEFFDRQEGDVLRKGDFRSSYMTTASPNDPRLDQAIIFRVIQGDTMVTAESSLGPCDPSENAPRSAAECREPVLLSLFRFFGFDFRSVGDCLAFVQRRR